MQLKPREKFVVVRQLDNPNDSGTYYVQAKVRNAHTDALLDTLNLSNKGGQRFTSEWQVAADPSGQGYYIDIETIVYLDSGYSQVSDVYARENETFLIAERDMPPFGAGGADVNYKRIGEIFRGVTKEIEAGRTTKKPINLKGTEDRLYDAIQAVGKAVAEIEVPDHNDALKGLREAISKAQEALGAKIDERPRFEKTDLQPVLSKLEETENGILSAVQNGTTRMLGAFGKAFDEKYTALIDALKALTKKYNDIPFLPFLPRPQEDKVEVKEPPKKEEAPAPVRNRRIPKTGGFAALAVIALIGVGSLVVTNAVQFFDKPEPMTEAPAIELAGTVSSLPQMIGTTSPDVAITQATPNKAIKITGLTTGLCLTLNSSKILTTTTCGTGGGGTATDTAWQIIPAGTRLTTTTGQVLIGGSATTTLAKLEIQSGNVFIYGNATATTLTATSSASTTNLFVSGLAVGATNINALGKVYTTPTSSITFSGPFTGYANLGALIGGSNVTVAWSGISTSSNLTGGQILMSNGGANVSSVATSSLAVTAPITFSGTLGAQVGGSGGSFGCTSATRSVTGCITSTDFTTFDNKVSSTSLSGASVISYTSGTGVITTTGGTFGAGNYVFPSLLTTTLSSTTQAASFAYASSTKWAGGGLVTDCDTAASSKILWDITTQQFSCGTDQNSGSVSSSSLVFISSGFDRQNTTTDQVLFGATATTSRAQIEIVAQGTNPGLVVLGNVGIGTSTPYAKLSVAGAVVGETFTATSTTGTSNFVGQVTYGSGTSLNAGAMFAAASTSPGSLQFVFRNGQTNPQATSSIDLILENASSTNSTYFGNIGMNSPSNSDITFTIATGHDLYAYSSDASILIGTASSTNTNAAIKFFTGGTLAANERMRIFYNGQTVFGGTATTSASSTVEIQGSSESVVGVGTTSPYAQLSIHAKNGSLLKNIFVLASSTASATTTHFRMDNVGHQYGSSTNPVLSSCGTSPSMSGSDHHGTVTTGATAGGCTITFAVPYSAAPTCIVTNRSMSVVNAMSYTTSATALTVTQTALGGALLDFICYGN